MRPSDLVVSPDEDKPGFFVENTGKRWLYVSYMREPNRNAFGVVMFRPGAADKIAEYCRLAAYCDAATNMPDEADDIMSGRRLLVESWDKARYFVAEMERGVKPDYRHLFAA